MSDTYDKARSAGVNERMERHAISLFFRIWREFFEKEGSLKSRII